MKRLLAIASTVVVATTVAFSGSAAVTGTVSTADAAGRCINLNYGGTQYVFYKQGIRCGKAKRWAKRVHRTRGDFEPRGYDCESSSNFRTNGSCRRSNRKYFGWYPEH